MGKFIFLVSILALAACKKPAISCGNPCSCVNTKNEQLLNQYADSDTVYHLILGTWYLQQEETWNSMSGCDRSCLCNSHYTFIFLPNKTLIRNLPGNYTDTIAYTFLNLADTTGIVITTGTYYIPGDSVVLGSIGYNSNFLYLSSQNQYYNSAPYYPYYPQYDYVLTR